MLAAAMPTKTKRKAEPAPSGQKEQFNVRLDPALRDKLDRWLADLNEGRRLPLKRSDLVRGVLDWSAENKPDFERAGEAKKGGGR